MITCKYRDVFNRLVVCTVWFVCTVCGCNVVEAIFGCEVLRVLLVVSISVWVSCSVTCCLVVVAWCVGTCKLVCVMVCNRGVRGIWWLVWWNCSLCTATFVSEACLVLIVLVFM